MAWLRNAVRAYPVRKNKGLGGLTEKSAQPSERDQTPRIKEYGISKPSSKSERK